HASAQGVRHADHQSDRHRADSILVQEIKRQLVVLFRTWPQSWLVGGWVFDVTEVRIRGARAANGPYFISAFSILD
ncbi:MAG: hypothetical protein IPM88_15670, partial [Nitrospira sp.]|nr:hypothetical protein [Nitrospira sp.]